MVFDIQELNALRVMEWGGGSLQSDMHKVQNKTCPRPNEKPLLWPRPLLTRSVENPSADTLVLSRPPNSVTSLACTHVHMLVRLGI